MESKLNIGIFTDILNPVPQTSKSSFVGLIFSNSYKTINESTDFFQNCTDDSLSNGLSLTQVW